MLIHKGMNPTVDFFFNKAKNWHEEFEKLRMIILIVGLPKN